ncbi:hypothetical protein [Vitiosangium sp. GDMCC 1.1324]|uniref:hypothetical protein n=1 Tax=Vitiosangium sp. (strain GDMCC 1.1324) TaxID=2138576 RepID=UPI000D389E89|nr:hypothetical protein [Vitiosangium sp. GDMCC 1.1324]PTL77217.1 hypothetical protein DAT35_45085 [Vitiosangium sp. GDMCC 1.1324]
MTPDPVTLAAALRNTLEDTARDFSSMPFFIRPMVRRGFANRTGRSLEEWQQLASALVLEVKPDTGPAQLRERHPRLREHLEQLAENYRTAPERASKGMGALAGTLQRVQEASRRREEAVRALIAWLG